MHPVDRGGVAALLPPLESATASPQGFESVGGRCKEHPACRNPYTAICL